VVWCGRDVLVVRCAALCWYGVLVVRRAGLRCWYGLVVVWGGGGRCGALLVVWCVGGAMCAVLVVWCVGGTMCGAVLVVWSVGGATCSAVLGGAAARRIAVFVAPPLWVGEISAAGCGNAECCGVVRTILRVLESDA
jgi:hypothetical protein